MSCIPGGKSLRTLIPEYARYKLRGSRETTRFKYEFAIDHWSDFLRRDPTTEDLSDDAILDLLWSLVESKTIKPVTANMYGAKLRALWNFAARKAYVQTWPTFPKLPEDESLPIAFTPGELAKLFFQIDQLTGWVSGIPARDWWRSLCLAIWDSAERITAIRSARFCDLSEGRLVIQAAARKGRAGHRRAASYRLHRDTVHSIEAIRGDRDLIWPWHMHETSLWNHLKRILKAAGLPTDRYHKFHCLRRSVASYSQKAGLDASAILGHTDRRVTVQSYLSPSIVEAPAPADHLFRPGQ
jgi:hypothetical protein